MSEGTVTGVKGQKKRKGRERSKMEEGEWGGETGRRLCMDQLVEKEGERKYQRRAEE